MPNRGFLVSFEVSAASTSPLRQAAMAWLSMWDLLLMPDGF